MLDRRELQHPLFNRLVLPVLRFVAFLLLTLFGPYRSHGKNRVPRSGGMLVLANHQSDLDPVAVQLACPRTIYFMAKSELFGMGLLGKLIRCFRAFPVKRGEPDKDAIKRAVSYLKAGETVCVFPEGELSKTGDLLELKAGVALIARMSGVPVICCGLIGTNRIMPYGKVTPRFALRTVRARWGEARTFGSHASAEEIMGWAEAELRSLIAP